ncbi:hypothetical protein [Desulfitibacter alkalitolerans]|uniref:hypothetical protein n=1 Tax=Desulfitibacter alkalitolerans TaxID=264641 RepID=UPI00048200F4|nr:hypothetical protein [Desulfitibacter alkalitolerans]
MHLKQFRSKAIPWMINRGWQRKLAKKIDYEQTLFDHTIIQLDILIAIELLLIEKLGLKAEEITSLFFGILLHDIGKEKEVWQHYIRSDEPYQSHIDEELTQEAINELIKLFNFSNYCKEDILSGVLFHMNRERTPGKVFGRIISKRHNSSRWKQLSEIVDLIDNLSSAQAIFEAIQLLEKSILSQYINISYHQVLVRGISTAFLHRSCMEAYIKKGWQPLIHYPNGTVYVTAATQTIFSPSISEIERHLVEIIENVMKKDMEKQVVGSPTASMLPKPDLFDYRKMEEYLTIAQSRINPNSFSKKTEEYRNKTYIKYLKVISDMETQKTDDKSKKYLIQTKISENKDLIIDRISKACQEMVIFKFFKTIFNRKSFNLDELEILQEDEKNLNKLFEEIQMEKGKNKENLEKKYEREIKKAKHRALEQIISNAQQSYDKYFGKGSFELLQKTTTFLPAVDMAYSVDLYWRLRAKDLDWEQPDVSVEELSDDKRKKLLIKTLAYITKEAYDNVENKNRPYGLKPKKVAGVFLKNLIYPAKQVRLMEIVNSQIDGYKTTKALARKAQGEHLCPICNQYFKGGTNAKADFVNKPESHTNRAPSHGPPGYVVICDNCKFERFCMQILLGVKPPHTIVIFPRMNIGYYSGEDLTKNANDLWERLTSLMSGETKDPTNKVSFSLTGNIYEKFKKVVWDKVSSDELANIFTYKIGDETQKKYRKEFTEAIYDILGYDLKRINEAYNTDFKNLDELIDAAISGTFSDEDGVLAEVRKQVYKLIPQMRSIIQTPHMILVPSTTSISLGNDSKANAGLRQLFILITLSLSLQSTVLLIEEGEGIPEDISSGIVKVPTSSGLNKLVGKDWLSFDEAQAWLKKIGSAAALVYSTDYPEKNNIFQIIMSPTPGHILRRIESKSKSNYVPWRLFEILEAFE